MRRAGQWAARQARKERAAFVLRNRWVLLGYCAFYLAMATALLVAQPTDFRRGFTLGGLAVGLPWSLWLLVHLSDGQYFRHRGAEGERDTSDELRKLRSSGWHVIDDVRFERWNVDHVLVGPAGVFAIETKWTSTPEQARRRRGRHTEYVRQARSGAREIRLVLKSKLHRTYDVRPAVAVWGPGRPRLAHPASIDEVLLIDGPELRRHFAELDEHCLDDDEIDDIVRALEEFNRMRDDFEVRRAATSSS
jgi:hypothetical protein